MVNPDHYKHSDWTIHSSGGNDFGKEVIKTEISNERVMDRYARLSQGAYNYYYRGPDRATKELKVDMPDYVLLPGLSDKNSIVTKRGNEVIISYRGTDPFNVSDLAADGQIAFGKPMELLGHPMHRFAEADSKFKRVKQQFPDASIVTTGHSLGGNQAQHIARKYDLKSYIFNTGSSPFEIPQEGLATISRRGRVKSFHVPYDLISTSQYNLDKTSENVLVQGDGVHMAHSLDNFLVPHQDESPESKQLAKQMSAPVRNTVNVATKESKAACLPGSSKGLCRQRVYNR